MATVSTRHCCSQSAKACRSSVNVGNDRTDSVSRSAGTPTKTSVAPISIPPALGLITGKLRSNLRCFLFFAFAMDCLRWFGNEPGVQKVESFKRDHRNTKKQLRVTNVIGHGPGIKLL